MLRLAQKAAWATKEKCADLELLCSALCLSLLREALEAKLNDANGKISVRRSLICLTCLLIASTAPPGVRLPLHVDEVEADRFAVRWNEAEPARR